MTSTFRVAVFLWMQLFLTACSESDKDDSATPASDADQDGFTADEDCDDDDPSVNPDADEVCDGVDNDCDGEVDEDDATDASTWFADEDEDGWGDPEDPVRACDPPDDRVPDSTDCDDSDPSVNPDATEICGDGLDNDCDGVEADCPLEGEIDAGTADARLIGETPGDWAGWSVAGAGDTDGDGFDDLLVGAVHYDAGGMASGRAYLVRGPILGDHSLGDADAAYLVLGPITGESSLGAAAARIRGENDQGYTGYAVAGAGDVDGDGFGDLLVGAYANGHGGDEAGAAYLFHTQSW